jgi:3-phosphoshikimate 1-carboxyvinyltransferase
VEVVETKDGMEINGRERLKGCVAESRGDHRVAMAMLVAGLAADGPVTVHDVECIATSFPDFGKLLEKVVAR